MKTLQEHIYENIFYKSEIYENIFHKSEINEKLVINKKYEKPKSIFTYQVKTKSFASIAIFSQYWPQAKEYLDKVYIDDEQVELELSDARNAYKTIKKYKAGIYNVEIKDIDNVTTCKSMFSNCGQLKTVPVFDTSKVTYMINMFRSCTRLVNVPALDVSNVKHFNGMFDFCDSLNETTKRIWRELRQNRKK